jgi:hypothetical protein
MSPILPNWILLRLPKLAITNGSGCWHLDLSSVSLLMRVNRNMLMLEHSGHGDRYAVSQAQAK